MEQDFTISASLSGFYMAGSVDLCANMKTCLSADNSVQEPVTPPIPAIFTLALRLSYQVCYENDACNSQPLQVTR